MRSPHAGVSVTGRRAYLATVAAQGISRALAAGANIVTVVLVARLLGAEAFGQFAYVLAYVGIGASLADLGTTAALARGLTQARPAGAGEYWGAFLALRVLLAVVVTAVAAPLTLLVAPHLGALLLIGSLGIPFIAARFFEVVFQVYERPRYSVYATLFLSLAQLSLGVILLVVARAPLGPFLAGWVATNAAYAAIALALTARLVTPRFAFPWSTMGSLLAVAAPVGVSSLFTAVNSRADVFLLTHLRSPHEVGLYSAAYKFLDLGALMAVTLSAPLIPILTAQVERDRAEAKVIYARVIETTAIVGLPIAIIAPHVTPTAIAVLYGHAYREAAPVVDILAWAFILIAYCLVGSTLNLAAGEVAHGYWNAAVAAGVNIGLNLVLIPGFGMLGAAWATVASELCLLAVSQYYVVRNFGNPLALGRWGRILAANAGLYLASGLLPAAGAGAIGLPLALLLYGSALALLRLVPIGPARDRQCPGTPPTR